MPFGMVDHHMNFPGTLSIGHENSLINSFSFSLFGLARIALYAFNFAMVMSNSMQKLVYWMDKPFTTDSFIKAITRLLHSLADEQKR
jgi:hypothetical protein